VVQLYKKNNVRKSDLQKAIENINQIDTLRLQKENLQKEVQVIREDRLCYLRDLENIKREYYRQVF
jgi:hypothetical protein